MDRVVLVPVKAFADAKVRLSGVLAADQRARLARWCAERVLAAAGDLPVRVVCDDDSVSDWAEQHGARVLRRPGLGLNGAVNSALAALRADGVRQVVVCHGDLPLATNLAAIVDDRAVVLVPDGRDDGTNVLSLPMHLPFEVGYGPGSFRRHLAIALSAGMPVRVRRDLRLGLDLDVPTDLTHPLVQEVLPTWLPTNPDNPRPTRI